MMDVQIGNPQYAWLTLLIALGIGLTIAGGLRGRRLIARFATANLRLALFPAAGRWPKVLATCLLSLSLVCLILAVMDIRWGKAWDEVPQKGLEVMFVLDVSRSMLAEDVVPNRLERAKQQIKDMLDEMHGDRVGLVAFAGDARQVVPLTSHYEDFKQTLDSLSPTTVRRGGSRLGDALKLASSGFLSKLNDHQAMVVITDGEDQESRPVEIAQQLYRDSGIRIFTIGIGDMEQGARIPASEHRDGGFVEYEGEQVWSKLNGQVLQDVAQASHAAYVPAGTRRVNMADIYHGYVAQVEPTTFETAKINAYIARFQWFALPALILLLLEIVVSSSFWRRPQSLTDGGLAAQPHPEAD